MREEEEEEEGEAPGKRQAGDLLRKLEQTRGDKALARERRCDYMIIKVEAGWRTVRRMGHVKKKKGARPSLDVASRDAAISLAVWKINIEMSEAERPDKSPGSLSQDV